MAWEPTFLGLPSSIRQRIFSFLVVSRECPIDLMLPRQLSSPIAAKHEESRPDDRYSRPPDGGQRWKGANSPLCEPGCICPNPLANLILLSHTISQEALFIFARDSSFVLRIHPGQSVNLLQNVSTARLASMTSLQIRLNPSTCVRGHNNFDLYNEACRTCNRSFGTRDPVWDARSSDGEELAQRWASVCERLSKGITPNQLRLTLFCEVEDAETAQKAIGPLLTLPKLKHCNIRLKGVRTPDLRTLVETTCQILTSDFVSAKPFPLSRLPQELRLEILRHTHPGRFSGNLISIRDRRNPYLTKSHICCGKCTDFFGSCCCIDLGATYSTSCVCRHIPYPLFTVSRQMYQDITQVIYAESCFEFRDSQEYTYHFLQQRPRDSLRLLRRLRFVLTTHTLESWVEGKSHTTYWDQTIDFIKDNCEVENMTIIIDSYDGGREWGTHLLGLFGKEGLRHLFDVYCNIMESLKPLSHLHDLTFRNGWLEDMGPLMEREVLGDRFRECKGRDDGVPAENDIPEWWWTRKNIATEESV